MEKYQPIACSLYDHLELFAIRKDRVIIEFLTDDLNITRVEASIRTIQTSADGEYLILADDLRIRLDYVLRIDDIIFKSI